MSLLFPSSTEVNKCSLLVTTSCVPALTLVVVKRQEILLSPKWAAYSSSVSLISSARALLLENALGSTLFILIADSGRKHRSVHLFFEVGVLDSHVRHFLPLLQYLLKADQVQSLSNAISIGPPDGPG